MRLSGLVSHRMRRTFMANANGVSRGDRNRNARLARLRDVVPVKNAIIGIDLADKKQMVVVTNHEPLVLARRTSGAGREISGSRWSRQRGARPQGGSLV